MAKNRIVIHSRGNLSKTRRFLQSFTENKVYHILERYGRIGVEALSTATPWDTGETALSWDYEIEKTDTGYKLHFTNSNVVNGFAVAILIQTGHASRSGTWVQGIDYINPEIQPLFERMSEEIRKEVGG